jgi:hypothetical protein
LLLVSAGLVGQISAIFKWSVAKKIHYRRGQVKGAKKMDSEILSKFFTNSPLALLLHKEQLRGLFSAYSRPPCSGERGFVAFELTLWASFIFAICLSLLKISQHFDTQLITIIEEFQNDWSKL